MKRHLKKNQYQLDDYEREAIWRVINGPGADPRTRRHSFLFPATGVALATAVLAFAMVWWTGTRVDVAPWVPPLEEMTVARVATKGTTPRADTTPDEQFESAAPAEIAAAAARPVEAPPPPVQAAVTGRIIDAITGQPLANANVLVQGTTRGVATDDDGRFAFRGLDPADSLKLDIRYLGYDPTEVAVSFADASDVALAIALEPVVVATLQPFDVTGAEYMVGVKSSVTEKNADNWKVERYAIDSVEDALSQQGGIVSRAGELYVRGGRSGEVRFEDLPAEARRDRTWDKTKSIQPVPATPQGSVTGGTTAPNGESAELMYFQHTGVNPFVTTEEDALSTFAVDVDNASWSLTRSYLERGALPPPDAVRVEEFVNAFEPGWEGQTDADLAIHVDAAPSRFGAGYHLLRIGLTGRDLAPGGRRAANLVFVVDVSGSMDMENRLGAVRHSLTMLLDELGEGDRVGLVVYGSRGEVRLAPTDVSRRAVIQAAIDGLRPAGSTNAFEGLKLAYAMARGHYEADKINRIILCSDGVANQGRSTVAEEMLALVRQSTDEGISLSTVGFGMGNYNDVLMEKLANQGDGNYAYVNGREEAERVFRENLTGMLETVAREAKVQVAIDPERVARWRLLGYENRNVADRDFRNDAVDAGEIGAGHRVTALYEVKLKGDAQGPLGEVCLRWQAPSHDTERAGEVTEISAPLAADLITGSFGEADRHLRRQALVAEFAEILRGSYWAKESALSDLVPVADGLAAVWNDEATAELARLIRIAARLEQEKAARAGDDGR